MHLGKYVTEKEKNIVKIRELWIKPSKGTHKPVTKIMIVLQEDIVPKISSKCENKTIY